MLTLDAYLLFKGIMNGRQAKMGRSFHILFISLKTATHTSV